MEEKKLSQYEQKWLPFFLEVYKDIFVRIQENTLNVFLCGAASNKSNKSMRDKIKDDLRKEKNIRILYPEDLFIDILNLDKKSNLLSLEKLLASNCDAICIVCESTGSFVELGAFTNSTSTFEKVIALVNSKYKNEKSFLMLGPVKYISSKCKENVLYYNTNIDETVRKLKRLFKRKQKLYKIHSNINSITNMYLFILLILFFVKNIEVGLVIDNLQYIFKSQPSDYEFNLIFRSAIKLLYKERLVEKFTQNDKKYYLLTSKGYSKCLSIISTLPVDNIPKLCDQIRFSAIKLAYY